MADRLHRALAWLRIVHIAFLQWLDRVGGEPPEPPISKGVQVRNEF